MKLNFAFVLLILLLLSCKHRSEKNIGINGVWQSIGSGWILQIEDSTVYSIYDITSTSCTPFRKSDLSELSNALTLESDTLSLLKGVMTYHFERLRRLPIICSDSPTEEKLKDPLHNFEVFAETVKDHYAFMELNKIEWPTLYQKQKSKLIKDASDEGLYKVLEETLEILNDNHAYLEATEAVHTAIEQAADNEEEELPQEELKQYGDFEVADIVIEHHLEKDLTVDSWLIKWGKIRDDVGYIQVKAMWLYADLDIPQLLIDKMGYVDAYVQTFHEMDEGTYVEQEVKGVSKIMDKVMTDLINMESIVIDLRFNGGGQDAVNFEILRRFNPQRRPVVYTNLSYKGSNTPQQILFLDAAANAYTNPTYVLTSQQTGSAAEAFAIGSMSIPHMKRIGSSTTGALSTALEKRLPNGWTFSISNEVYMDINGNSFENIGVPVDYELGYPENRQTFFRSIANDLLADKKDILAAITQFKN